MELRALVQSIEQPWQPGAVALQKSDSQLGKLLQDAARAEARYGLNQFQRIAQSEGDDIGVGMAEEFIRHLILLRPCRRMEAKRHAEFFNLRPQRIEAAIVDTLAVDRLRAER